MTPLAPLALYLTASAALANTNADQVLNCMLTRHCDDSNCQDIRQPLDVDLMIMDSQTYYPDGSRGIAAGFGWQGERLEYLANLHADGSVDLVMPPGRAEQPFVALSAAPGGPVQLAFLRSLPGSMGDTGIWFGHCKGGIA